MSWPMLSTKIRCTSSSIWNDSSCSRENVRVVVVVVAWVGASSSRNRICPFGRKISSTSVKRNILPLGVGPSRRRIDCSPCSCWCCCGSSCIEKAVDDDDDDDDGSGSGGMGIRWRAGPWFGVRKAVASRLFTLTAGDTPSGMVLPAAAVVVVVVLLADDVAAAACSNADSS